MSHLHVCKFYGAEQTSVYKTETGIGISALAIISIFRHTMLWALCFSIYPQIPEFRISWTSELQ